MTDYRPPSPESGPPNSRDYWAARPPWFALLAGAGIFVTLVLVTAILLRDDTNEIQTATPTLPSQDATSTSEAAQPTSSDLTTSSLDPTSSASSSSSSSSTTAGSSSTTSTTAATTSTAATTTTTSTTTTTENPDTYLSAMWPWVGSSLRYSDPVDAARGFAEDYVGFSEPIVGVFQQGDARSGEVSITPAVDGPITTVFVRQLGAANTWWVLGAATENITIGTPDALDTIDSPLQVSGEALAFEGVVDVELRTDGSTTPLVTGTVTGGGTALQPFDGVFSWTNPGEGSGAVVLLTRSMDDNRVWTVAAVRVAFATG